MTISTFWKPWFHNNFNGLAISTFYISLEYDNFYVIQFQRARAARARKNTLQFQQTYNFYFLNPGKCDNFNGLTISTFVVFWEYDNFNIKHPFSPKFMSLPAIEVHFSEQRITQNPKVRARRRRFFVNSKVYLWGFPKRKWVPQTKFSLIQFHVFAISTFWKLWVHHNFNGSAISTFGIFWNYNNFNVTQFQRARAARPEKNTLQFQQVCNFYVLNFCRIR